MRKRQRQFYVDVKLLRTFPDHIVLLHLNTGPSIHHPGIERVTVYLVQSSLQEQSY